MFTPPPSPFPRVVPATTSTTTPGAATSTGEVEMNPFEESLKVGREEDVEEGLGTPSSSSSSLLQVPSPLSSPPTSPSEPAHRLTPPPTLPSSPSFHTPTFSSALSKTQPPPPPTSPAKRRLASRLKWSSLLIPILLIVITASTRWISHPAVLDFVGVRHHHADESLLHIHRRHPTPQDNSISISIGSSTPDLGSSTAVPTTTTAAASQGVPTIPVTPPVLPTPFPQPWDESGIGLNFSTQGCLDFFQNMTNTAPFRSCRPFSMLSLWSSSFTAAQSNISLLNDILWGTCNPSLEGGLDQCTQNMRWFEREMVKDDVCGKEMSERNDLVVKTRGALLAYPLLQSAACLSLSNTNTYCYVSSIAGGASHASDIYLYSLPLGIRFPDSAQPSCGACEKDLLGVFGGSLGSSASSKPNTDSLLNLDDTSSIIGLKSTYADAVQTVQRTCGQNFVQTAQASSSGVDANGVAESLLSPRRRVERLVVGALMGGVVQWLW
ncbi:hypothetical protein VKT23_011917 [Stygiomarasmius scandens]|uniref:DUF7729 domain-containing protein n=1 Tax=Marasmiellus scandens TaxID=2682957 RepID=A0ABR1J7B8_9AGAR